MANQNVHQLVTLIRTQREASLDRAAFCRKDHCGPQECAELSAARLGRKITSVQGVVTGSNPAGDAQAGPTAETFSPIVKLSRVLTAAFLRALLQPESEPCLKSYTTNVN